MLYVKFSKIPKVDINSSLFSRIKSYIFKSKPNDEVRSLFAFGCGDKHWFFNTLPHRENGPAFESYEGIKEWWLNGTLYNEEEFNVELLRRGLK